jgi:transposase
MQKSLELMSIKFHTLFADILGKTSKSFIEAILAGERNPAAFLPLVSNNVKADKAAILKSLEGNWRTEHIFTLRQSYEMVITYQQHIAQTDAAIESQLQQYQASVNEGELTVSTASIASQQSPAAKKKKKHKGTPAFNIRSYLEKIYGTDVLAIYGLSEMCGLEILSEVGVDLTKWETSKHFVSWLNLCPNNKISGGKLISSKLLKKKPNTASQAFRTAANALQRSNHWLGDYFRRMKSKGGNKFASVATGNKIATIFYNLVTQKKEFTPLDLTMYQKKQKRAKIAFYERKLNELKTAAT